MAEFSRFLPSTFSNSPRLAIIAGRGHYPAILLNHIPHTIKPYLVALRDETDQILYDSVEDSKRIMIEIGQIGKLLTFLKKNSIEYVIMAGQIQPKRLFNPMNFDLKAISILARLKTKNAATIFGAVTAEIEKIGVHVLDGRAFMDDELATFGDMTDHRCKIKPEHLEHGIMIAKEIARLDIGQAVICRKGTTLAVEDFAGTDDLIKNCSKFKLDEAFLIKVSKNNQDFRFDTPIFGKHTLELMNEYGIKNAVLEKDGVIILDKQNALRYANDHNLSLLGF